jgi:hypothetical protein
MSLRGAYKKTKRRELILRIQYLKFEGQSSFGNRLEQIRVEIVMLQAELDKLEQVLSVRKSDVKVY